LVAVGLGLGEGLWLGDGLPEGLPDPVELGEGEAERVLEGVELGLDETLLLGLDDALLVALGLEVALLVDLGVLLGVELLVAFAVAFVVAVALAVAEELVLAEGDAEPLGWVVLEDERKTASRTTTVRPPGTERAAEVVAGGWPHTLGAAALTVLESAAPFTVLASAARLPPRSPPTIPEETMATLATRPNAEGPDRADFMAAPSSPWSSSSRPRVS
jgi:hypothetical protein